MAFTERWNGTRRNHSGGILTVSHQGERQSVSAGVCKELLAQIKKLPFGGFSKGYELEIANPQYGRDILKKTFWQGVGLTWVYMRSVFAWDTFFLDWVLFANIKRVRLPGTEHKEIEIQAVVSRTTAILKAAS